MLMCIVWLAQSVHPDPDSAGAGLFSLLLIGALLGIGLLVLIGLIAAWRNYIQRQSELDIEHEERQADLPRPDAWSTAAQRMDPPDAGPDEAHVGPGVDPDDSFNHEEPRDDPPQGPDLDDDDDEDDFPFDRDDEDDDDGPIDRV